MSDFESLIPVLVRHDAHCTRKGFGHSDAAKRVSDMINMHWSAAIAAKNWDGIISRWVVFRLQDGTGGTDLYDTKRDAVRHQPDPSRCMFLRLAPGGMGVCEAELQLRTHRQLFDNGARMADPDHVRGGPDLITRIAGEHRARILKMLQN